MKPEELVSRVRQILEIVAEMRDRTSSPGFECTLHDMEVACHMALNYLGEADAIAPELV